MFQTFPRASRSWLHDESILQGADAYSHVRRDRGKPFTSLSWLRSSSWLVSDQIDRALFYNFISSIGYFISTIGNCPFYQILLLRNLQKVGHSANFGQWRLFFIIIILIIATVTSQHHHHNQPQVLIFSALTYMSEKEIPSTSFTSVIDAFW